MCYGEGNSGAAIGDGVFGWELRIPEEKARIVGYEDPASMQEAAGLVEETSDTTGSGSAAGVRRDGKLIFCGGRRPVEGLGGEISKWAELGGSSGNGKPSLHRAKIPFKRPGLGLYKKKGKWVVIVRPNNLEGIKKGLTQESIQDSILGLPASKSGELKTESQTPSFAGESSGKKATPLDQGSKESPLKNHSPGMFPRSTLGGVRGVF